MLQDVSGTAKRNIPNSASHNPTAGTFCLFIWKRYY